MTQDTIAWVVFGLVLTPLALCLVAWAIDCRRHNIEKEQDHG